mgnify:CR=1 FL=1
MILSGKNIKLRALVTNEIKAFYEKTPFPNYEGIENIGTLIQKAESGGFAKLLDDQIPYNAKVLDVGCGTGQLSNFLAASQRSVYGVDLCFNSLKLALEFKVRNELSRAQFYQMNLFMPIFKEKSFDFVICNGVLHHTASPFEGFKSISGLVKNGGYIMIGLYNKYGRIPNDLRKIIFRIFNNRPKLLDPRIRKSKIKGLKLHAWINDQYHNPHESRHTLGEVLQWFDKTGFEFINSITKPHFENGETENILFKKTSKGNSISRLLAQAALLFSPDNEGVFFIMTGRRKS